jgi:integrase
MWKAIFEAAGNMAPCVQNSMLLAVVTGQRRGDIAKMKFSDVWDGHLHVEQKNRGETGYTTLATLREVGYYTGTGDQAVQGSGRKPLASPSRDLKR